MLFRSGVSLTLAFIVILDANSLRQQIGKHAKAINKINSNGNIKLRERIGHTKLEILAGISIGMITGLFIA